jgi:acyl-CoA synthetase (AMP-forming)/AMP-acid ligase II
MAAGPELARISDWVAFHAARKPDERALVLGARRWTYRELALEVDQFARALLAAGVAKGDRVALLSNPRPECFLALLATASIGGITLGLNPKFPIDELRYFVGDAEPKLLIGIGREGDGDHAEVLRRLDSEFAFLERTVVLAEREDEAFASWNAWLAEGRGVAAEEFARAREAVATSDPALIVYTSGSTGRPKGAVLPHRALSYCSMVQVERWTGEPLRILCNLPVNHIGFMGDICSYGLVGGGTIFYMEKFDPQGMLELIQRERLTGWGQVPTMFQLALSLPNFREYDLSSLQWIIWGGACAARELIEALMKTGARLATSYGMTETGGSVTYTDADADLDALANTVGRPDPHFEVRIAHPDGTAVAPGEEGEIQVRGDHIMLEYWRRPEATREAIDADGWLHTADVATLRQDGNYALRGRLSEMYKSGGENVYPREVERVLEQHPKLALAAVIGVPDPVYSEVGHAFVLPAPGADPGEGELRAFCKERLANFKVPKAFFVCDALPMLPIGKVDKVALRRAAIEALGRSAKPPHQRTQFR